MLTTGTVAGTAFAVRETLTDGVTPVVGAPVVFSALVVTAHGQARDVGGVVAVRFGGCGQSTCTVLTDATGLASITITPLAAGTITLAAKGDAGSETGTVTAVDLPSVMTLVSAPSGTVFVGSAAGTAFAVRVMQSNGVTAVAGTSVVFSASGAGATFGPCGVATCTVLTDATGLASTTVTPLAAGAVTLSATGSAGAESAAFTAVDRPNVMAQASGPAGIVYVGDVAATAFAVRVVKGDGVTPVAGTAVGFSAGGAAVRFGACGLATCTVMTDATGLASTTVTPLSAGAITLLATGSVGSETADSRRWSGCGL